MKEYKAYLDNAATTKILDRAFYEMLPYFKTYYENASGNYKSALSNRRVIDDVRATIGDIIGGNLMEIYFTSGGTEANNWALKGVAQANKSKGKHIITSQIEHHSVLHPLRYLEQNHGFKVTYLPVGAMGIVNPKDVEAAITKETILISIMFANNEIGTLQPIKDIGAMAKRHKVLFHTDAVQALGRVAINVEEMAIDLLTMSGHKVYGPKGVGALYIKAGTKIEACIQGGPQERGRRGGTENVPGIVAFGKALAITHEEMEAENQRLKSLTTWAISSILKAIPNSFLNGHVDNRLPNIFNISFKGVSGEDMLILLDKKGVVAAGGSACTSGSLEASHVILALGKDEDMANASLRVSLGRYNTKKDMDILLEVLPPIVEKLRS